MMKQNLLLILLFVLFLTPAGAQDTINQFDDQGRRHGLWKRNFEHTDEPRYEGSFNHGKEVGVFKFYILDGNTSVLSATREFDPHNDHIKVKFFSSKGKLISEGQMMNKAFVGKWLYYHHKNKHIMTVEHYNDRGTLEGEKIVYYPNGQITEKSYYKNGKIEGTSKVFSETGVLIKEISYKDGKLNGISKYYNSAGQLLAEGAYKDDQKHGIWKSYDNGVLTEEKDFTEYSKNPERK